MHFDQVRNTLQTSPLLRLLRARTAPLMLSFFYQEFVQDKRKSVPQQELIRRLADYLEHLKDEDGTFDDDRDGHGDVLVRARKLLDKWTDQLQVLFLNRDSEGENYYDLTVEAERAVQFVQTIQSKKSHVGTESRFKDLFYKLRELVENASSDPDMKLAELERQKGMIEAEISLIRETGKLPHIYNDTQIRERFDDINRMARELVTDFREVERNFRDIGHDIYEKQQQHIYSKGEILGIALDAREELKEKDQGRSFYAFWQFLQSETSQQELHQLVARVYGLLEERGMEAADENFLKRMKRYLHQYGQRVVESNQKMADRLNRLIAEKNLAERKRALELIQEIRTLALKSLDHPPRERGFIQVEIFRASIQLLAHRTLYEPSQQRRMIEAESAGLNLPDNLDLSRLFNQFQVDKPRLDRHIRDLLRERASIDLHEVLQFHPAEKGLSEILTYMSIASQSKRHTISSEERIPVIVNQKQSRRILIPKVTYYR